MRLFKLKWYYNILGHNSFKIITSNKASDEEIKNFFVDLAQKVGDNKFFSSPKTLVENAFSKALQNSK